MSGAESAATGTEQLEGRLVVSVSAGGRPPRHLPCLRLRARARGELPNLRLGRRLVVPTRQLLDLVAGVAPQTDDDVATSARTRLRADG